MASLVAGCGGDSEGQQTSAQHTARPAAVPTVLIVDASGSMTEADAPGPRMDAAKRAAQGLVDGLPDDAAMSLVTYGTGTGSADVEKVAGCRDVKVLIPFGRLDRDRMAAQISGLTASGYTPIGLALTTAVAQLPAGDDAQAIVLVSDGEDTCDTPPCETAGQIKQAHPNLTISTVGFKTDGVASDQLRCIANATGGIFVQADNASQLAARLLATQNLDEAQNSLSDNGVGGIELGASLADIRKTYPDFPAAPTSGSVKVEYRDCDYGFVDGVLDWIAPHGGGRTIDGVVPGTPLSRVTELYGNPVNTETDGQGGYRVTYSADPHTDAGYRMVVEGYTESGGTVTGTVKTIVLCRCAPKEGPAAVLPDVPPAISGCPQNVISHRDVSHKTLGVVRIFLLHDLKFKGCIAPVSGAGEVLPAIPVPVNSSPSSLSFADPEADATGNVFIVFSPRYSGVLVLVPTVDGFQQVESLGDDIPITGERNYYPAELGGPGADGKYTVRQFRSVDDPPGCLEGSCRSTSQDLHWNGTDYVP